MPGGDDDYRLGSYLESVASRESRADVASLRPLLRPRSVAVVCASRRRATVGRAILHNIVTGGFTGPVYAVNPRAQAMEGVPCVASVDDLPGPVDLAVIAVPPPAVPEVAEQCGRHGVRALRPDPGSAPSARVAIRGSQGQRARAGSGDGRHLPLARPAISAARISQRQPARAAG